jgi:hypothetical protein
MKNAVRAVLAATAIFAAACGGGSGSSSADIVSTTPSGTFDGKSWTMSKATITRDGDELTVHMFADPNVADCDAFQSQDSTTGYLLFSVPAKVGVRPLQLSLSDLSNPDNQTVTFVTPPSNNDISTDGVINVSALSDTSVTLGVLARTASGNEINGTVTTDLCP